MVILVSVSVIIMFLFLGAGYEPAAQPPIWRTRGCSSSGLYPLTNPAWLDLPGTKVPADTALWVIETHKLHHHGKVSAQGIKKINLISSYDYSGETETQKFMSGVML